MPKTETKHKGALPLMYGTPIKNRNGKIIGIKGDACPRPLSRKKLKQLMPMRSADLTSLRLHQGYGRKPGGFFSRTARFLRLLADQTKKTGDAITEKG
jgi:hypothetical protein